MTGGGETSPGFQPDPDRGKNLPSGQLLLDPDNRITSNILSKRFIIPKQRFQ